MMPERKNYSYTDLGDTPKHGDLIESSYLPGEKGPKSTWAQILELVVLLATIGGCAYVLVFMLQNGNQHPGKNAPPSEPHAPVGAASASSMNDDDAACLNHPACTDLRGLCCPTNDGVQLQCCEET